MEYTSIWTPPINERADLTRGALYLIQYSEVEGHFAMVEGRGEESSRNESLKCTYLGTNYTSRRWTIYFTHSGTKYAMYAYMFKISSLAYQYNQYCNTDGFKCPRETLNKFVNHMSEDITTKWTVQNMASWNLYISWQNLYNLYKIWQNNACKSQKKCK
jgi:hypothetical protein